MIHRINQDDFPAVEASAAYVYAVEVAVSTPEMAQIIEAMAQQRGGELSGGESMSGGVSVYTYHFDHTETGDDFIEAVSNLRDSMDGEYETPRAVGLEYR